MCYHACMQAEEVVDKVVKEAISKPWLPLPLGLKPPSPDSVLAELSRQGISNIPPKGSNSCWPGCMHQREWFWWWPTTKGFHLIKHPVAIIFVFSKCMRFQLVVWVGIGVVGVGTILFCLFGPTKPILRSLLCCCQLVRTILTYHDATTKVLVDIVPIRSHMPKQGNK